MRILFKLFRRKKIVGILIQEPGKNIPTSHFVGETIHKDHPGDCIPEGKCDMVEIEKISVKRNGVVIHTREQRVKYINPVIKTIWESDHA